MSPYINRESAPSLIRGVSPLNKREGDCWPGQENLESVCKEAYSTGTLQEAPQIQIAMATAMSLEADVRYLLDRLEIQDVIQRYGIGQDDHQGGRGNDVLTQWDEVFTEDATVDYTIAGHVGPDAPYRDLARQMRGQDFGGDGSMSVLANWQHFEGVPTVAIDGDTAQARTPHLHTHKGKYEGPGGWNVMEAGIFVDELRRTPDGWRITHRKLEVHYADTLVTQSDLYQRAT